MLPLGAAGRLGRWLLAIIDREAWRRRRRNLRKQAARAWTRRVRAIQDTHVEPCIACRSTQLCVPDCYLAPWNLDSEPTQPQPAPSRLERR